MKTIVTQILFFNRTCQYLLALWLLHQALGDKIETTRTKLNKTNKHKPSNNFGGEQNCCSVYANQILMPLSNKI